MEGEGFLYVTLALIIQSPIFGSCLAKQPHIVFILADDLGWGDVGFHGSEIFTPNLDRLAADGLILENFYGGPQCTPSRASLMSGRYPSHVGMQHHVLQPGLDYGLPLNISTLADNMKKAGYRTHAVGKWHLGKENVFLFPLYRRGLSLVRLRGPDQHLEPLS